MRGKVIFERLVQQEARVARREARLVEDDRLAPRVALAHRAAPGEAASRRAATGAASAPAGAGPTGAAAPPPATPAYSSFASASGVGCGIEGSAVAALGRRRGAGVRAVHSTDEHRRASMARRAAAAAAAAAAPPPSPPPSPPRGTRRTVAAHVGAIVVRDAARRSDEGGAVAPRVGEARAKELEEARRAGDALAGFCRSSRRLQPRECLVQLRDHDDAIGAHQRAQRLVRAADVLQRAVAAEPRSGPRPFRVRSHRGSALAADEHDPQPAAPPRRGRLRRTDARSEAMPRPAPPASARRARCARPPPRGRNAAYRLERACLRRGSGVVALRRDHGA